LTDRINPHFRVLADHQFRQADAPRLSGSDTANQILDNEDNLVAVRLWATY